MAFFRLAIKACGPPYGIRRILRVTLGPRPHEQFRGGHKEIPSLEIAACAYRRNIESKGAATSAVGYFEILIRSHGILSIKTARLGARADPRRSGYTFRAFRRA
jgi:hypothetical protein